MKKLFIKSFGCQMNDHDAEQMVGLLQKEGYTLTTHQDEADMIIMNTCSIRDKAEQKAYSEFGKLDGLKKNNPDLIIGFAGCVAQQEGSKILQRISNVDFVMGPRNISDLPEIINRVNDNERVVQTRDDEPIAPSRPSYHKDTIKAWVTIMEGCDYGCTYCVVPTTRGAERSRPSREIFHEVEALANQGFIEITLLGQTVNSYGRNLNEIIDFSDLLKVLHSIEGLRRIRFMTSHPNDLTQKLVETIRRFPKLCKHLHLPVQSGSDKILNRMKRGYTVREYRSKVDLLRSEIPGISMTSDIITGFPGETDEEFKETLKLLEEVQFDAIFAFKYSNRPNTLAPLMDGQVGEELKSERLAQILELQQKISRKTNLALLGTIQEVLVDSAGKNSPERSEVTGFAGASRGGTGGIECILQRPPDIRWSGRTDCNRMVHFNSPRHLIGQIVPLKITETRISSLEGELV